MKLNRKLVCWIIDIVVLILVILSSIVGAGAAMALFCVTLIMLLEAHFAMKPTKGYNGLKQYYHHRGKPEKYRRVCLIFAAVFSLLATCALIWSISR